MFNRFDSRSEFVARFFNPETKNIMFNTTITETS